MGLLPYCIVAAEAQIACPRQGVGLAEIREVVEGSLRCIYSENELGSATQADALAFHAVVHQIFAQTAVIQFRFPTLVSSEQELLNFIRSRQAQYGDALRRWQNDVQMEVQISTAVELAAAVSGREYLQSRSERERLLDWMAGQVAHAAIGCISAWRRQKTSSGVRCFALVKRRQISEFQQRVRALAIPEELRVVVSGPWPISEFLQEGMAA